MRPKGELVRPWPLLVTVCYGLCERELKVTPELGQGKGKGKGKGKGMAHAHLNIPMDNRNILRAGTPTASVNSDISTLVPRLRKTCPSVCIYRSRRCQVSIFISSNHSSPTVKLKGIYILPLYSDPLARSPLTFNRPP